MSHDILLAELRRKSAERRAAIRKRAEREAEELREAREREFAAERERRLRSYKELAEQEAAAVVMTAERQALQLADAARHRLADRLRLLALEQVDRVRRDGYDTIFADLVAELPAGAWERVWVSPGDVERARAAFPDAETVPDETITGGFKVECDGGRCRVVSTLKQRLQKGWPFTLPVLFREIEEERGACSSG